ncbi:MAG: hypothetical protein ACRDQ4_22190 [Pseudonocardiaceae bacterium]
MPATTDRQAAIRDVAAGVAAPALIGCVIIVTGYRRTPSGEVEALLGSGTNAAAHAWGNYPYDSDPAGTATRPPARCARTNPAVTAPGLLVRSSSALRSEAAQFQ